MRILRLVSKSLSRITRFKTAVSDICFVSRCNSRAKHRPLPSLCRGVAAAVRQAGGLSAVLILSLSQSQQPPLADGLNSPSERAPWPTMTLLILRRRQWIPKTSRNQACSTYNTSRQRKSNTCPPSANSSQRTSRSHTASMCTAISCINGAIFATWYESFALYVQLFDPVVSFR